MNLRTKTISAVGATMLGLMIVQHLLIGPMLMRGFERSEMEFVSAKAASLTRLVASDLKAFHDRFGDWSNWDDLCEFVENGNDEFVSSNLNPESLDVLGVCAVGIVSSSGKQVFCGSHELGASELRPLPEELARRIAPGSPWLGFTDESDGAYGLIACGDRLAQVCARPILASDRSGPVRGTLVMARWFGAASEQRLADLGGVTLELRAAPGQSVGSAFQVPNAEGQQFGFEVLSEAMSKLSIGLNDVDGRVIAELSAVLPRRIYLQGRQTAVFSLMSLLIAGIACTGVVLLILERFVLRRVSMLSHEVVTAAKAVHPIQMIESTSGDELGRLSDATRRSLESLLIARQQAEDASRAKSEFLANMSHEIRTPMTAILGFAEILNEPSLSAEEVAEHVATIRRSGEHLLSIINDILDLSKIEAGRMVVEHIACSPVQIAEEVVGLMTVRAEQRELRLNLDLHWPLPRFVIADPLRLRQILVNLIGNAIKFTERGAVTFTMRLESTESGRRLLLRVEDTGVGMAASQLAELFKPFTQVDGSSSRNFGGTGLGLTISRRLARMMKGEIEVESTPGLGSTFTFWLPVEEKNIQLIHDSDGTGSALAMQRAPAGNGELCGLVLLAEDGPDNQRLLTSHLRRAGLKVESAFNGREALDRLLDASKLRPDLVLMDMQMPVMDGYEAVRACREHGYSGPIIALTAHAMAGDREKCLLAGCDGYLSKPIDRMTLLAAVEEAIAGRRRDAA